MRRAIIALVLLGMAGSALAQPQLNPGIDSRLDFEDGRALFQPFGEGAQVSVTREAANVKSGRAALRFDYQVAAGQLNAALIAGAPGAIADVKSFRFWVKADYDTNLVFVLQEQDGGRYLALFHAPQNRWQRVELSLDDFFLSDDKDDPKDPNGKLDMNLVVAAAIGDFNQLFAQAKKTVLIESEDEVVLNAETKVAQGGNRTKTTITTQMKTKEVPDEQLMKLLGVQLGDHTLYLDDFWASKEALPLMPRADAKNTTVIDGFTSPQISWIGIGGSQMQRVTAKEAEDQGAMAVVRERGLWAQYRQKAGAPIGMIRRIPRGKLASMAAMKLTVATERPVVLVVQLEEKSGGKYHTTVQLPGESKAMDVRLVTTLFVKSDDSKDDNDRLDLDQVHQIVLLDATGLMGVGEGDNQLWLSDVLIESR